MLLVFGRAGIVPKTVAIPDLPVFVLDEKFQLLIFGDPSYCVDGVFLLPVQHELSSPFTTHWHPALYNPLVLAHIPPLYTSYFTEISEQ